MNKKYISDGYALNEEYKEILKLDKMLKEAKIPHTLVRMWDGWRIGYPDEEEVMDAIEHKYSYGCGSDQIEIMGLLVPEEEQRCGGVLGHLFAEEVFERITKHWRAENDKL